MNDERYYPAFKRLAEMPDWRVYQEFLAEWEKTIFEDFMRGDAKNDLQFLRASAMTLREIRERPKRLIVEVEDIHKRRNQK